MVMAMGLEWIETRVEQRSEDDGRRVVAVLGATNAAEYGQFNVKMPCAAMANEGDKVWGGANPTLLPRPTLLPHPILWPYLTLLPHPTL